GSTSIGLMTSCASGQLLKWNGSAWACASDASGGVTLPFAGTTSIPSQSAFSVTNTGINTYGIQGEGSITGVLGISSDTGVEGNGAVGVRGTGTGTGVAGIADDLGVSGVGGSIGVFGIGNNGTNATGVLGQGAGTAPGVFGFGGESNAYGV